MTTTNSDKFHFNDFTHSHYAELVEIAKNNYRFCSFNDVDLKSRDGVVFWRHDIDFSMHESLNLAKIETDAGIKSTFFLLLHGEYYNLFELSITKLVREIIALGHHIGLHFDPVYYNIITEAELKMWLMYEKQILDKLFDIDIKVFSFHNPTPEILKFDNWDYSGMINTYSKEFKDNVAYCSDSNGYWRFKRLKDVLETEKPTKLQTLTHPEWWTQKVMSPKEKIWRAIDKRAEKNKEFYENSLTSYGRNLIDW